MINELLPILLCFKCYIVSPPPVSINTHLSFLCGQFALCPVFSVSLA